MESPPHPIGPPFFAHAAPSESRIAQADAHVVTRPLSSPCTRRDFLTLYTACSQREIISSCKSFCKQVKSAL